MRLAAASCSVSTSRTTVSICSSNLLEAVAARCTQGYLFQSSDLLVHNHGSLSAQGGEYIKAATTSRVLKVVGGGDYIAGRLRSALLPKWPTPPLLRSALNMALEFETSCCCRSRRFAAATCWRAWRQHAREAICSR